MIRSKYGIAWAALVAALAFGALAAASASATLPEFQGASVAESITFAGGSANLDSPEGPDLMCATSEGTGPFTSHKGGNITLTFKGCRVNLSGLTCTTSGHETGVIVTGSIPFQLVYTEKEPTKKVAVAFNYKGATLASFNCGASPFTIRHTILAPVTPLNTFVPKLTVSFTASGSFQEPRENYSEAGTLESNFPEVRLNEGPFMNFGLQDSGTLKKTTGEMKVLA
jgi:hypothetical protein